jgi:Calx-beta domain/Divergent InlB B-repeat domain/Chitobiase/beta-hexosaminidase C-terminal domain/Immunoglobulin domain
MFSQLLTARHGHRMNKLIELCARRTRRAPEQNPTGVWPLIAYVPGRATRLIACCAATAGLLLDIQCVQGQTPTIAFIVNGQTNAANHFLLPFGTNAQVAIISSLPNGTIYYTTDGTPVGFASSVYTGPFITTTSIEVQAFAFDDHLGEASDTITNFIQFVPGYTLTDQTPGGGTVSVLPPPTGGSYGSNTVLTLTAIPAPGWTFSNWSGGVSGTNPILSVAITNNLAIGAVFVTTLRLSALPLNYGSVVASPPGGVYPYGTVVELSALPNPGNYFLRWATTNFGSISPLTIVVTNSSSTNYSALFSLLSGANVSLALVADGPGTIQASPSANYYSAGSIVSITAVPEPGDNFLGWSGGATGSINPLPVTLTSNTVITANFSMVFPQITLQPFSHTVLAGSNVTLSVSATGTLPLSYQWWFNGTNLLAGATDAALTLPNARAATVGGYTVVISNSVGTITSSVARVSAFTPDIIWTGGGDGFSWSSGSNWNTSFSPGPTNSIFIGGNGTISNVPAGITISNMLCQGSLTLSGSLSVTGAVEVSRTIWFSPRSSIQASGPTALITSPGMTVATSVSFIADQGALISLPGLTNINNPSGGGTIYLNAGRGAVLDLSSARQLWAANDLTYITINPQSGGVVDLSGLTNISSGSININPSGTNSVVNLANLRTFSGRLANLNAQNGGTIWATNLSQTEGVGMSVDAGSTLDVRSLLTISNPSGGGTIHLTARSGAVLDLSSTRQMWAANDFTYIAVDPQSGGVVDLSGLTNISSGSINISAAGAKSVVDIGKLRTFSGLGANLNAANGGTIWASNLTQISGVGLIVDDQSLLALSSLTTISNPRDYPTINLTAGPGGVLDLSSVRQMWAGNNSTIQVNAQTGALVSLRGLTNISSGIVSVNASNANSDVNLTSLITFNGPGTLTQGGGGVIQTNAGTIYQNVTFSLAPAILVQPQNIFGFFGSNATISVVADGNLPLSYQWFFNQTNAINGATSAALVVPGLSYGQVGGYTVVITNVLGAITSAPATLSLSGTIVPLPKLPSTLLATNSPYFIFTNVVAGNLTIQPGVSVLFAGPYSMTVTGLLQAVGTSNNPILFERANPSIPWSGLVFNDASTNSQVQYCVIEGAANSGLQLQGTPLLLQNCTIANNTSGGNGGGIKTDSSITLKNCLIRNNSASAYATRTMGGGIYCSGNSGSAVVLTDCTVANNSVGGDPVYGGGVGCDSAVVLVQDSIFSGNSALALANGFAFSQAYGGAVYTGTSLSGTGTEFLANTVGARTSSGGGVYASTVALTNCSVTSNQGYIGTQVTGSGGGISCGSLQLYACLVTGNAVYFGGGGACSCSTIAAAIYCGTAMNLENCIIANNPTGNGAGKSEAVILASAVPATIGNCVFYNNGIGALGGMNGTVRNSIFLQNPVGTGSSSLSINYSLVPGTNSIVGTNNIDDSPIATTAIFADTTTFLLAASSPAIDAGDPDPAYYDAAFPPALGGNRNDLGAHGGPWEGYWISFTTNDPVVVINGNPASPLLEYTFTNSYPPTITFTNGIVGGHFEYTLDGSNPLEGHRFTEIPLVLTHTAIIRAISFSGDSTSNTIAGPVTVNVLPLYNLVAGSVGGGSVFPASGTFLSNTVVTLTATNAPGWTFLGWAGDASGTNNPLALAVDGPENVQAIFGTPLLVNVSGVGSVQTNPALALYPYGANVQLSAIPGNPNTYFAEWGGGGNHTTISPLNFVVTNAPAIVTAIFGGLPANNYSLTVLISGSGSVTQSPLASYYTNGATVVLTAVPASGQIFTGWSLGATGSSNPFNVTMNGNKLFMANFADVPVPGITITNPPPGSNLLYGQPVPLGVHIDGIAEQVTQVLYYAESGFIASGFAPGFGAIWQGASLGAHALTAQAFGANGILAASQPVPVVIKSGFQFDNSSYTVNESQGSVTVTVLRTNGALNNAVFTCDDNTASSGRDYLRWYGTLTFTNGETQKSIPLAIIDSAQIYLHRTFKVRLADGLGAELASADVIILDDDTSTNSSYLNAVPPDLVNPTNSLRVTLNVADGLWRFPWDEDWRAGGDAATGLLPGDYSIQYKALAGYQVPFDLGDTIINVPPGNETHASTYLSNGPPILGTLTVLIAPPAVTNAQWEFAGQPGVFTAGIPKADIPVGSYIVTAPDVPGWITPSMPIDVVAGEQRIITLRYFVDDSYINTNRLVPGPIGNGTYQYVVGALVNPQAPLPYGWNGQLRSDLGEASGVVVKKHVVLTAAHVVWDEVRGAPAANLGWFFQRYGGQFEPRPIGPSGVMMLSNYAAQRSNDLANGVSPGVATPASRALDVAVLYFDQADGPGRNGYNGFLFSDPTNSAWLESGANKMLVGYPSAAPFFTEGTMYATPVPETLAFELDGNGVYRTSVIRGFPGNSGGPVYVQHSNGRYYPAAVYLGSSANYTYVRAIDSGVVEMINIAEALAFSQDSTNHVDPAFLRIVFPKNSSSPGFQQLSVNIQPSAATNNGARWSVYDVGAREFLIPSNQVSSIFQTVNVNSNYLVVFSPATGFTVPPPVSVRITNSYDVVITANYLLPPNLVTNPASLWRFPHEDAIFQGFATGAAPLSYQWLHNGIALANATNNILHILNVGLSDAGTYTLAITNVAGHATSQPAVLTLLTNLPRLQVSLRGGIDLIAPTNRAYYVQRSTDLASRNWSNLFSVVPMTGVTNVVTAATVTNSTQRSVFYRVLVQP